MARPTIQIAGVDELKNLFDTMPDRVMRTASTQALRGGAGRLRTKLRRAAPKSKSKPSAHRVPAGTLRKAIKTKVWRVRKRRPNKVSAAVWLSSVGGPTPYYYSTLEDGRLPHKRRGRQVRGTGPMHPFWDATIRRELPGIASYMEDRTLALIFRIAAREGVKARARVAALRARG